MPETNKTYTAKELATLAGVSVRTLHYYEERGLLHPTRDANNWRRYNAQDLSALRVVLALRACGLPLTDSVALLDDPALDMFAVLTEHRQHLLAQQTELTTLLHTTETLIERWKDIHTMTDKEAFELLKQQTIAQNEQQYGEEAHARYVDAAIDAANEKLAQMSQQTWESATELEAAIKDKLRELLAQDEISDTDAHQLVDMHAQWLQMHWGEGAYSAQAHIGLAQGYLLDDRFVDYYDSACGDGATALLVHLIETALM